MLVQLGPQGLWEKQDLMAPQERPARKGQLVRMVPKAPTVKLVPLVPRDQLDPMARLGLSAKVVTMVLLVIQDLLVQKVPQVPKVQLVCQAQLEHLVP